MSKFFKSKMSVIILGLFVISAFTIVEADDKLIVVEKNTTDQKRDISAVTVAPPTAQEEQAAFSKSASGGQSLGAYSVDGGSPGHIVGRTWRDIQGWVGPGRMVDWRGTPSIHFAWMGQACEGTMANCGRYNHYNMYDPTTDTTRTTWVPNATGMWLPSNPLDSAGSGAQLDVNSSGHAIVAGHSRDVPSSSIWLTKTFWDIAGAGQFGNFENSIIDNSQSQDVNTSVYYPRIAYQEYGGQTIVHLINLDTAPYLTYWRKVGADASGSWSTQIITDSLGGNIWYDLSASSNGQVGVTWLASLSPDVTTTGRGVRIRLSDDAGVTWPTDAAHQKNLMTGFVPDVTSWSAYVETSCAFDSDGYFHVTYNAWETTGQITPVRIYHWTNRVAGSVEGGTLSVVSHIDNDIAKMCGRGWTNVLMVAKPVLSECDGRLFAIWQQFGDTEAGDSTDCAADIGWQGSYNSDIFLAVSSDLDGSAWSERINITNSKTPGCDGNPGTECDHDNYATMSRFGMNTASMGTTYWTQVQDAFDVRDVIAPGYPENGHYLDVIYINDLQAGLAYNVTAGFYTNNPMKWFRLPCGSSVVFSDDNDGDGVLNSSDNCPNNANPGQEDTDGDSEGDACDLDDDNDGVLDVDDADPLDPAICEDIDSDGCDDCSNGVDGYGPSADNDPANDGVDTDSDGICDVTDNCPSVSNPDQLDTDGNGTGDACQGLSCCGEFSFGQTGNADCSEDGKRNLADITLLIDNVYISKTALCCPENGNVDGDVESKTNLADITNLIDHVYINKSETAPCE